MVEPTVMAERSDDTVLIVDDDALVRDSMVSLFRSVGMTARSFAAASDLLAAELPAAPACLVVDVRMPQIGGFELHERLAERGREMPVVFVTGHGDIPMTVRAMKAGAVDFLPKPFRDQDMLDAVNDGLARSRRRIVEANATSAIREACDRLTPREREVMGGVVQGLMNKQIAHALGLSEITIKLHRSSLMKKLGVRTVPDLVRMAQACAD